MVGAKNYRFSPTDFVDSKLFSGFDDSDKKRETRFVKPKSLEISEILSAYKLADAYLFCTADKVYRYDKTKQNVVTYDVSGDTRVPIDYGRFSSDIPETTYTNPTELVENIYKSKREETNMAEVKDQDLDAILAAELGDVDLDAELNESTGDVATSSAMQNVGESNPGDDKPKTGKERAKESKESFFKRILGEQSVKDIQTFKSTDFSDAAKELQKFNKENGSICGFIVKEDARIVLSSKKVYAKGSDGNEIPLPEANKAEVKKYFDKKAGNTVSGKVMPREKLFTRRVELYFRQAPPSKIIGSIVKIPVNGLVEYSKVIDDDLQDINLAAGETVAYKYFVYEDVPRVVSILFGGSIREESAIVAAYYNPKSKEEYKAGDATSEFEVETKHVPQYRDEDKDPKTKKIKDGAEPYTFNQKVMFKHVYRKKVLSDINYIPLARYKTINVNADLTAEEAEELNKWYFKSIMTPRGNSQSKYDQLLDEQQAMIDEVDGKITTKWFTDNMSEKQPIEITHWYTGEKIEPMIPIKRDAKGDGKYRYVKESLIGDNAGYGLEEFPTIQSAVGESLTKEAIEELVERYNSMKRKQKRSNQDIFAANRAEAARLIAGIEKAQMDDKMDNIKIIGMSDLNSAENRLKELLN